MKGYFIRQLMADNMVKVCDIAKNIGVSQVAVSRVIHGQTKSAKIQAAISAAINKDVSEVFPGDVTDK